MAEDNGIRDLTVLVTRQERFLQGRRQRAAESAAV